MYNVAREEGKDIGKLEAPVDSSIPDYFVYELYKNGKMTADSIAKKLRTNVQEVKGIITRQLDVEARLNTVKDELVRGAITKTYEVV